MKKCKKILNPLRLSVSNDTFIYFLFSSPHNFITYTGCPTRYRFKYFFNNFSTNEDIATEFEADLSHFVRNVKEKNVFLFKFRCNIFIGVGIIKEMPGSVASGTPVIFENYIINNICKGHNLC
jgi:hypothetical protein